jgi:TATA-box binding protein (TBP) (component of TFIID and TFIIIB)
MNEDAFNISIRKFLKKLGVTAQREIEMAVRNAVAAGQLKGDEKLSALAVITVDGLDLRYEVDGDIELA